MNTELETLSPSVSLSKLATMFAGASRVFHQHRLDYCCGGAQSLKTPAPRRASMWTG